MRFAGQEREHFRYVISRLFFQYFPIDGPTVQPWRCSSFQTSKGKAKIIKSFCKPDCRWVTYPSCRSGFLSQSDNPSQKCTRCQNDRLGCQNRSICKYNTLQFTIGIVDINNLTLKSCEVCHLGNSILHCLLIEGSVHLGPWPLDGRSLAAV